jgi:RNA polymerase sigma-70 factor (ECF subfamily)
MIREGLELVEVALRQGRAHPYTIQAAISALHAQAEEFAHTDWTQIVALYDLLIDRHPNPVLWVNRAVALSYAVSPDRALQALDSSGAAQHLVAYQPYHSCRADLLARIGQGDAALAAYDQAIALAQAPEERSFLISRRNRLATRAPSG